MNVALTIPLAALALMTAAASSLALDAPKPDTPQSANASTGNDPKQPRVLEWQDLIPQEERDRPFVGSSRTRPLFDDESGPAAFQEGSTAVNKALDGKQIKLPGFVVPLSVDKNRMISDFLLVPYFGACIHVPPPPPNQIVYVAMSKPMLLDSMFDPVWVTGRLTTRQASTGMASASYSLSATVVEKYQELP